MQEFRAFFRMFWGLRLRIAAAMGVGGFLAGVGSLWAFDNLITSAVDPPLYLIGATVGAFLAGLPMAPFMGRPGGAGYGWGFNGFFLATLLGACLAGLLVLEFERFGLVFRLIVFTFVTPVVVGWLAIWLFVQFITIHIRSDMRWDSV